MGRRHVQLTYEPWKNIRVLLLDIVPRRFMKNSSVVDLGW